MAGKRVLGWVGRSSRVLLAVTAVGLPLAGLGCGHHHVHSGGYEERVYVDVAPPVDRVEVLPIRPSPDHIWISGHHAWRGGVYVWVGGHYEVAPRRGNEYVRGHWDNERGRYFWIEGHWR